jgi:glycosyltransferase involved in cell wall biosynthesis
MSPIRSFIIKRMGGYRRKIIHDYSMWTSRRKSKRNLRNYDTWIHRLRNAPPDIFLGPDAPYGGVRGHVRNIHKYSSLHVQLVPDEKALGGLHNFWPEAHQRFMDFVPEGKPVVHSHVDPWMIHWCRKQQEHGSLWVHTYHNMYFPEFSQGPLLPWQIEINDALINDARYADVRLSISLWQKEYLLNEHGIQTSYLPNGVDVEGCDSGLAERFRRTHPTQNHFVLYVGRNEPVKNPADFVRLAHKLPETTFVMLGEETLKENLIRDWGVTVPPNLVAYGGATHGEVQDALAACSALVVTSKREGLPTLVLEAMAHNKPVVVPNEAGCVEAIGNGKYGLIYRHDDIQDLAEKTVQALEDPEQFPNSRQHVLDQYDWRVVSRRLDQVYRSGYLNQNPIS